MPKVSEKSRWGAGPASVPAPTAPPPKRRLATRELVAIVAGSAAVASLGVAVLQVGDDHQGVSLSQAGWQDMARAQANQMGATGPSDADDHMLVAETRAEHDVQTRAFATVLRPVLNDGAIKGFVMSPGPGPEVLSRAGIRPGDVIVAVNGLGFQSTRMLADLSEELSGSKTAEFIVERDGVARILVTKL